MDFTNFSLALGGGAARGLCSIGVIQYLEEIGVRPVEISGTSIGAIIGACYAFGLSSKEMTKIVSDVKMLKLVDFDFRTGLLKGDKINKLFKKIFSDTRIEDLSIPLKIVTTDFDNGQKFIFDKGLVTDAIRASINIPCIFSFFKYEGKTLVDGGMVNNLPIEVLEGENILAVSAWRDMGLDIIHKKRFFGLEISRSVFSIGSQAFRKMLDIMIKQNEDRSLSTPGKNIILIHPKNSKINYHMFDKYEEIIKSGYEEAKKKLNKVKSK